MQLLICFHPFKLIEHKWSPCFFAILLINQTLGAWFGYFDSSICMHGRCCNIRDKPPLWPSRIDAWNLTKTITWKTLSGTATKGPTGSIVSWTWYIFQALMGQWKSHYSTRTSVASSLHHCNGKTSTFRPLLPNLLRDFDPSGRGTMQLSSSRRLVVHTEQRPCKISSQSVVFLEND